MREFTLSASSILRVTTVNTTRNIWLLLENKLSRHYCVNYTATSNQELSEVDWNRTPAAEVQWGRARRAVAPLSKKTGLQKRRPRLEKPAFAKHDRFTSDTCLSVTEIRPAGGSCRGPTPTGSCSRLGFRAGVPSWEWRPRRPCVMTEVAGWGPWQPQWAPPEDDSGFRAGPGVPSWEWRPRRPCVMTEAAA